VANIADPKIWPEKVEANQLVNIGRAKLHDGKYLTNQGAKLFQRQLVLQGEQTNLCVLVLDVLWDVAGAIMAYEMNRFQPESVLMLGGGGGPILEGGALNYAELYEGYYADGKASTTNFPVDHPLLANGQAELPMQWDNKKIRADIDPLLKQLNFDLDPAPRARDSNTYLCNHVSYVALASARGMPIDLAGGLIHLEPKILSQPHVGFFHLPWNLKLDKETMESWGSVVLSVAHFMGK
jgi:pyrrolidone-carboxylate peptidase